MDKEIIIICCPATGACLLDISPYIGQFPASCSVLERLKDSTCVKMLLRFCWTSVWFHFLLTSWIVRCAPSPSTELGAECNDFDFTVQTTARNDTGVLIPAMTSKISAFYCPPTKKVVGRGDTVQLLLHGASFTKYYWSAFGPVGSGYHENLYSWVDHFRNEGFHIVAVDRLGAGNSTQPNSSYVTALVEVDVTRSLVDQLRSGVVSMRKFDRIVLAAHSYGSFIVDLLLYQSPKVADAIILTGYAHNYSLASAAASRQDIESANKVFPKKFGKLDSGYITQANVKAIRDAFYGHTGSFDPALPTLEFETESVQPVGELRSIQAILASGFGNLTASNFTASLALVIGAQDGPFCDGNCGQGPGQILANAKEIYSKAKGLLTMTVPNTGHVVNLHYSAPDTFRKITRWLTAQNL